MIDATGQHARALTLRNYRWCRRARQTAPEFLAEWVGAVWLELATGSDKPYRVIRRERAREVYRRGSDLRRRQRETIASVSCRPDPAARTRFRELLAGLTRKRSFVLILRYEAGLPFAEIAGAVGVTTAHQAVKLHDAAILDVLRSERVRNAKNRRRPSPCC